MRTTTAGVLLSVALALTCSCGRKSDAADLDSMLAALKTKSEEAVKSSRFPMAEALVGAMAGLRIEQELIRGNESKELKEKMAKLVEDDYYDRCLGLALSRAQQQRLDALRARYRYIPDEALKVRGLLLPR